MIYKYQKVKTSYTDYTLVGDNIVELTTLDGWTYVMIPDDSMISEQLEQVQATLTLVDNFTTDQIIAIKSKCPGIVHILTKINQDVNTYILSHYDVGTQSSFNGLYSKRDTPDSVRDLLDLVWVWIESVMTYYYTKKTAILSTYDYSSITWDFSQFDLTKPDITLIGIMTH